MKRTIAALFLTSTLFACGGNPWMVVRQATPNPMTPESSFVVDAPTFDGMRLSSGVTESEWMSQKSADTRAKWDGDKKAMVDSFAVGFADAARDGNVHLGPSPAYHVRTRFVEYEPGSTMWVNTYLVTSVIIEDEQGHPLDEVKISTGVEASLLFGASAGGRARDAAQAAGHAAARYVASRVAQRNVKRSARR